MIDPEALANNSAENEHSDDLEETPQKQFWMPDKFCRVCYSCEEAFTMYRRRHHCRMCGQIFCNGCSSFYIDGKIFNTLGLVRACKLCFEQQIDRIDFDGKLPRPKLTVESKVSMDSTAESQFQHQVPPRPIITAISAAGVVPPGPVKVQDTPEAALERSTNLQNRYYCAHIIYYICYLLFWFILQGCNSFG